MLLMLSSDVQQMNPYVVGNIIHHVTNYCSQGLPGRAIGIGAAETFDLRDDIEGLNAGITMKKYREGEAKDLMEFFGQRP